MKRIWFSVFIVLIFIACDQVKDNAKKTIHKSGEVVGTSATELYEGISGGIDKTLESKLLLSQEIKGLGLAHGAFQIEKDSSGSNKNNLVVYLIFNRDFDETVNFRAFDKNSLEIGRSKFKITSSKGSAGYYDIQFDPRTNIGAKSTFKVDLAN